MIDYTVKAFTKDIKNIGATCLTLRKSTKKHKRPYKTRYKHWYNKDCQTSQKLSKKFFKNLACHSMDPIVKERYYKMRKEHKNLC